MRAELKCSICGWSDFYDTCMQIAEERTRSYFSIHKERVSKMKECYKEKCSEWNDCPKCDYHEKDPLTYCPCCEDFGH